MAILDKFHIIRKAVALIQLFSCIIVFTFSLILLIIGSITVATANSTDGEFYSTTDYVSGGNLLIVSGLFGIGIAIIAALGAVPCLLDRQDNLNLWVGLVVLIIYILVLVGIFIFEISAGGWAYSKWATVSDFLESELVQDVQRNYGSDNVGYTNSVDLLQQRFMCCGIAGREDWDASLWKKMYNYSSNRLPSSCCGDSVPTIAPTTNATMVPPTNSTSSLRRRRELFRREITYSTNTTTSNATTPTPAPAICLKSGGKAYTTGCWEQISNTLSTYTVHIAGITIALAILQILILLIPIVLLVIVIIELRRSESLEIK